VDTSQRTADSYLHYCLLHLVYRVYLSSSDHTMEVVGAVASIVTLVGLSKEIASIARDLLHGFHQAPTELVQISNHVALITLELECIDIVQQDNGQGSGIWLISAESSILQQSLTIAKNSIMTTKRECEKYAGLEPKLSTRLSWALFDSKTMNVTLDQLQKTESHLLFVLQIINT
jgi:hypothetical protein